MTLQQRLKNCILLGFEGLDVSKMLGIMSDHYFYSESFYHYSSPFKCLLSSCMFTNYKYTVEIPEGSKLLFFYSHTFFRNDHFKVFQTVFKNIEQAGAIYPEMQDKRTFTPAFLLRVIPKVVMWYFNLKNAGLDKTHLLDVLAEIVDLYRFKCWFESLSLENKHLLTVYYDAAPIDNMLVQIFLNKGITTATLQHGIFTERREGNYSFSFAGTEFNNTISDYFLAWNRFTADKLLLCGIPEERIKVLGIPKYMGYWQTDQSSSKGLFGVVLNSSVFDHENRILIEYAEKLAKEYDLRYFLKYHPNFKCNEYDDCISERCAGICERKTSVAEYVSTVDFSLISSSSVFFELVFLHQSCFRYVSDSQNDRYAPVTINAFSSYEQLIQQYICSKEKCVDSELFEYLCATNNPLESYRAFFKMFDQPAEENR